MADAKPGRLPLDGGFPGARVTLHPIRSGTVRSPQEWFVREPGPLSMLRGLGFGGRIDAPIVSFALEHPGAGPVLVDTGLHPSVEDGLTESFGRAGAFVFRGTTLSPDGSVRRQLTARGIDPAGVRTVLMTHLHGDHASGLIDFPGTEVLVSGREWSAANAGGALHGYHRPQLEGDVGYRLLDFDGATPHGAFERTLDLFGDGSVLACSTPGHTHGHLSVLVRTAAGPVLIAGDAIYTMENLREGRDPLRMEDPEAYRRSVAQLRAFIADHPDAVVIPGHEAAAWNALETVY